MTAPTSDRPTPTAPPSTDGRRGIPWWTWLLAALPWAWFLVRNGDGAADLVAVAMPAIGALALAAGVFLMWRRLRVAALVAASVTLLALVVTVLPRLPQPTASPVDPVDLVSANVFRFSRWPGRAAALMTSLGADVVVSVEMGSSYQRHLTQDAGGYPYSVKADEQEVLSVFPLRRLPTPAGLPADRVLRVRVDRDGGPFVLYAVHLPNPLHETTFAAQRALVTRLSASVNAEDLPSVVAGDLNLSDRIAAYRLLDDSMRDAMRAQAWPPAAAWPSSTYLAGLWRALLLRIDHVFVPRDWCARNPGTFRVPGSDHLGLQVEVGPCPA
jgi:endonuclease/exonuclease/phosphatase (EEP) superfamily protein YafD